MSMIFDFTVPFQLTMGTVWWVQFDDPDNWLKGEWKSETPAFGDKTFKNDPSTNPWDGEKEWLEAEEASAVHGLDAIGLDAIFLWPIELVASHSRDGTGTHIFLIWV